jgi:UDP-N-acetylmuramoylalanine--D-glutamate ligase
MVCGMGKSGIAAAELLKRLGADVTLQDIKDENKFEEPKLNQLKDQGISLLTGANPSDVHGLDLMILSPGVPLDLPFVERAKEAGISVWGEIELAYRLCPAPITAITGTNGKTTTTALCYEIMKAFNPKTEVVGNIGVPFCEKIRDIDKDSYVVAEISSFQLESVQMFRPRVAAVLNITPDHLNRHGSMENYTALKNRVFENQMADDWAILNYDDELCRSLPWGRGRKVYFSRVKTVRDGVFMDGEYIRAELPNADGKIVNVNDMKIFGAHNVENALAATAASLCAGVPAEIIEKGLLAFEGVEHRIEYITEINGVKFYNDSKATNTDAAIKSIEAMKSPIELICGGFDKRADFSQWVKMFDGKVRHAVVIGEVTEKIIETCKAYEFENYDRAATLKEAVEVAFRKARPGDCVLLSPACASFDMFENYERRGELFKRLVLEMRG